MDKLIVAWWQRAAGSRTISKLVGACGGVACAGNLVDVDCHCQNMFTGYDFSLIFAMVS